MNIPNVLGGMMAGLGLVLSMPAFAADETILISGMGAKCLDAEGGAVQQGTRLIGYQCNGQSNQKFSVENSGEIKMAGWCVDAYGGQGKDGDRIVLWECNGGANQRWRIDGNRLIGINGKCLDLKGGEGHWFGNQEALLYSCHGGRNQTWYRGKMMTARAVSGAKVVQPGEKINIRPTGQWAGVIAAGGGNVINAGGANVINAGGGNVIAVGGAN